MARAFDPNLKSEDIYQAGRNAWTAHGLQWLLLDVSRTEDNSTLFVTHDVSEAVYLGDAVYVLSSRPARILHRVDVPFFAERNAALKSSGEFRAVEKQLLDLLYAPQR